MRCVGMTTVRDESWIIKQTLNIWSEVCPDGIFVYSDDSRDATPALCRSHPNVKEVIDSNLYWEGERALMNSTQLMSLTSLKFRV